jgi:hypothetical protein
MTSWLGDRSPCKIFLCTVPSSLSQFLQLQASCIILAFSTLSYHTDSCVTMPRPTKKRTSAIAASVYAAIARKRHKTQAARELRELDVSTVTTLEPPSPSVAHAESVVDTMTTDIMDSESCGSESDAPSEGLLSEEEDEYPIGQPEFGWEEAERRAHGYSKSRVYKQKLSYHKNKEELKRRREEKKALSAGIPVTQRPKPKWGIISNYFGSAGSSSTSASLIAAQTSDSSESPQGTPAITPQADTLDSLDPLALDPLALDPLDPLDPLDISPEDHHIRPYVPPNFEEAFLTCKSFQDEARELEIWLKGQKGKITGDWLLRVECVLDLLRMQHRSHNTNQATRRKDWIQYSEALARRVKRSARWASCLRLWTRNWFETRSHPPCPRRGRHVKRQSLFFDEGVALAVREYLNTAMWHTSAKGVCEAIAKHLQSENSAVDIMRIDAILRNSQTGRKGISRRTAARWLVRMGWVFKRDKKGFCDGHERPDVVEYREKVFCPRMKVSSKKCRYRY